MTRKKRTSQTPRPRSSRQGKNAGPRHERARPQTMAQINGFTTIDDDYDNSVPDENGDIPGFRG